MLHKIDRAGYITPMLACQQVCLSYAQRTVLREASFTLPPGNHALITGASGSGKTTLLMILSGLLIPDSGQVVCDGQDVTALAPAARDRWRARHVGMLLQDFHLIRAFTVWQNLVYPLRMRGVAADATHLRQLLTRLGIDTLHRQSVTHLSRGEQQRVAIARALAATPRWIICDEPTSALDDANCAAIMQLLQEEAARLEASLIIVTHDRRVRDQLSGAQHLRLVEGALQ